MKGEKLINKSITEKYIIKILNIILNFFFPNICGICEEINEKSICSKCKKELEKYLITNKTSNFSSLENKLESKIYFDEQIYFYKYDGIIREKFIKYKFGNKPYLYKMFAESIFNKELVEFCNNYDYLIPVPIDKSRMSERGYNQSVLIAKEIIKYISEYQVNKKINIIKNYKIKELKKKKYAIYNKKYKIISNKIDFANYLSHTSKFKLKYIQLENKILFKHKNINPQSTMNTREDRIKNIQNAFKLKNIEKIKNKKIIIFDDIFTTGSTANECAKLLKNNGALKVGIITIAKD